MNRYINSIVVGALLLCSSANAALESAEAPDDRPRIFIAGDSTAANGNGVDQVGWAVPFAAYFDAEKVEIRNKARGGRSSRTFITEGHWERMLLEVRAGDVVCIQFGHNDGGAINREPEGSTRPLRARGSLPGLGNESAEIDNAVTGKRETVYTYGHYMRQMIADTIGKGATPILLSLTVRNIWNDGRIERGSGMYREWSYALAVELGISFVNLSYLAADRMEEMGKAAMDELYPKDHTHTGPKGAKIHAEAVLSGLKGLRPSPIEGWLSEVGEAVEPDGLSWLKLPVPAKRNLPSLFLIGDSTVRNGRGDGKNGEWGWGDFLYPYFDSDAINVVNRAVGGLSSRTYYTGPHWRNVLSMIRPGDFVIMQFGHNDNIALNDAKRARGTIKGIGDESEVIDNMLTGKRESVRTYGWYLRRFIAETRAKGATPIVCSLVPRKVWMANGKIDRSLDSYPLWARLVAREEGVAFLDLRNAISDRYDEMGREAIDLLFADERTHTSRQGAELNARIVASELRRLEENPLEALMLESIRAK